MWLPRGRFLIASLLMSAACTRPPVEWQGARTAAVAGDVTIDATGRIVAEDLAPPLALPATACPGSLRAIHSGTRIEAVWWSPRADSSARLEFAHSSDGGAHWTIHSVVDSTDHGVTGCRRSPPAIAFDSASGYIHVSYGLVASEGAGLFFSHSMDAGALFHSPVPIMYGDRLGATSVSASGDIVAVAFEDPNSATPRIGLALSRTMGHIFESRMLPVSEENGAASHPIVAVRGRHVTVAWRAQTPSGTEFLLRVRTGVIR
jgi:hypothetical protein